MDYEGHFFSSFENDLILIRLQENINKLWTNTQFISLKNIVNTIGRFLRKQPKGLQKVIWCKFYGWYAMELQIDVKMEQD